MEMKKINVQLLFTQDEYDKIKVKADSVGLTVPLYIKSELVQDNDFGTCYRDLIDKVNDLPAGVKFNIKSLFGVQWTMSRGVKLNLGKTFYAKVSDGVISNVKSIGKDSSNTMWYEKL